MEDRKEGLGFHLLMAASCVLTGLMAGGSVDRYIVQVPAWRHMDVLTWADYSRFAEFGNGLYLYPFEVLGSFILLFTTTTVVLMDKSRFRHIAWSVHLAAIFSTIGLVFTFFSFPIMLGIQTMGNNRAEMQAAFEKFHFWGLLRAVAQVLSFIACVSVFTKSFYKVTVSKKP
jgi:hypothetical protein